MWWKMLFGAMLGMTIPSVGFADRGNGNGIDEFAKSMAVDCDGRDTSVKFGVGSAELNKEATEVLDVLAHWLLEDDARYARVEAYADPSGSTPTNQKLTARRAQNVEAYLESFGIDSTRVQTFARGEVTEASDEVPPDSMRVAVVGACTPQEQANGNGTTEKQANGNETTAEPVPEPLPAPPVAAPTQPPPPTEEPHLAAAPEPRPRFRSGIGIGLSAGGGVFGLADSDSEDLTDTGGSWEVRAVFGTQYPAALELAYVGTAQSFDLGPQDLTSTELIGNGLEANLRLQYPGVVWRPYGFVGIGWMYYNVNDEPGAFGLDDTDNIGTVPMGVGLAIAPVRGLLLDIRATYRAAFEDELLDGSIFGVNSAGSLSSWGVTANIGAEF